VGVEVGVKAGEMSELFLAGEQRLHLYMVDRWKPADPASDYAKTGDTAANATKKAFCKWLEQAWAVHNRYWKRSLPLWCEANQAAKILHDHKAFDFVYLDADHSYIGRLAALNDWVPLVRSGGLVAGGLWNSSHGGDGCARAVTEFIREQGFEVEIEHGPHQTWRFIKP